MAPQSKHTAAFYRAIKPKLLFIGNAKSNEHHQNFNVALSQQTFLSAAALLSRKAHRLTHGNLKVRRYLRQSIFDSEWDPNLHGQKTPDYHHLICLLRKRMCLSPTLSYRAEMRWKSSFAGEINAWFSRQRSD